MKPQLLRLVEICLRKNNIACISIQRCVVTWPELHDMYMFRMTTGPPCPAPAPRAWVTTPWWPTWTARRTWRQWRPSPPPTSPCPGRSGLGVMLRYTGIDFRVNYWNYFRVATSVIRDYLSQLSCGLAQQLYSRYYPDFVLFNFTIETYSHMFNRGQGCPDFSS